MELDYNIGAMDIVNPVDVQDEPKAKAAKMPKQQISPYDLVKSFFTGDNLLSMMSREAKKQSLFMVNRILSIQYPLQANQFNVPKVNECDVLEFWRNYFGQRTNGRAPSWMYTKVEKRGISKGEKISPTLIKKFCVYYDYTPTMVEDAFHFFPEQMAAELKDFEKLNNDIEKNG